MTPQDAFRELLARLGAKKGAPVLISGEELSRWPTSTVQTMKAKRLLLRASPAATAVCPGCEQECVMLVHTLVDKSRIPDSFVVCDKRDDINRVSVPTSLLEQWRATGAAIAELLADLLGLRCPDSSDTSLGRWEVGVLKGARHSSHVVLQADGGLTLSFAGHSVPLADVVALEGERFKVEKRKLVRLVDKPAAGAGDSESAVQRRARLAKRKQEHKNKGTKAFLKAVADEEGISVTRLKQLLKPSPEPSTARRRRASYSTGETDAY